MLLTNGFSYREQHEWRRNMIKLIASDMDGTLLNDKGELPTEFYEVFKELRKKNILFAAASGRQPLHS